MLQSNKRNNTQKIPKVLWKTNNKFKIVEQKVFYHSTTLGHQIEKKKKNAILNVCPCSVDVLTQTFTKLSTFHIPKQGKRTPNDDADDDHYTLIINTSTRRKYIKQKRISFSSSSFTYFFILYL